MYVVCMYFNSHIHNYIFNIYIFSMYIGIHIYSLNIICCTAHQYQTVLVWNSNAIFEVIISNKRTFALKQLLKPECVSEGVNACVCMSKCMCSSVVEHRTVTVPPDTSFHWKLPVDTRSLPEERKKGHWDITESWSSFILAKILRQR